jgi:hypothetical protein
MQIRTLLLFVLIISSCQKDLYIPIPDESDKPVVNLLMNKDSAMMARVTLSARMKGGWEMTEIRDAVLNLYENGQLKETLTPVIYRSLTYYRGNTLPKAGATYRVTAAVAGYKEASGSDQIPDTVKTGELKMTVAQVNDLQTKATISVQLHDDPAVQNYYRIRLYRVNEWLDASGNPWQQKLPEYFEIDETTLPLLDDNVHSDFYTTDALFNGRSPKFIFRITAAEDLKKMIVEITSLTYHSYNYLNSAYMARKKNEDGLSEKVIVYNNVINGLGIIGGVAQREYLLQR